MNTCKICDSKEIKKIELEETYYHCRQCDLIYIDEEAIVAPKEEKARYEEHDNTRENEGYVNMFERFIEKVIEPYENEIETVLEFGCGPGPVLADLLAERGFSVDKYDPYFYPKKVFKNKKYDLITATEVFEHLEKPLVEIKNLAGHLRKGGYLAVMTSFHPGADEFKDWWYKWDPTHITFYNERTFAEISERCLLSIVYIGEDKYCLFKRL